MKDYKELIVWQKSIDLVQEIYISTDLLPKHEIYCLANQIRRAAISIPSNIAEGSKRGTRKDYLQFIRIASGSAAELETQLIILKRLYPKIDIKNSQSQLIEIQKMLAKLCSTLSTSTNNKI